MEIDEGL